MYAGEDGEVCVELGYVGKAASASKAKQPDKSKAGGWPAWFGEAPVDVAHLVCRLCGRCLYLVTQIYAPTHVQRSLCVFGCNRATCSLRPGGWRVIRTQAPPPQEQPAEHLRDANVPTISTADNNSVTVSVAGIVPPMPPIPSQEAMEPAAGAWGENDVSWDAAAPDEDEWGAETSEWGAGVGNEGTSNGKTADIGALLDERDKKTSMTQGGRAAPAEAAVRCKGSGTCDKPLAEPRPNGTSGSSDRQIGPADASGPEVIAPTASAAVENGDGGGRPYFPAKNVSFMPEPWGAESSGADDKDMKNRLRRYREQEEDRGLVAALDQALGLKDGGVTGNTQQGMQGARGGVASIGEKYERTPARAKAAMRFADRVARSPQQVVRYAYGGQPLWSAFDPPKEDMPPCACGATRVFEMQLMPALLLQLQANDLADREPIEQQGESNTADDSDPKNKNTFSNEADGEKNATNSTTPSAAAHQPKRAARTPSSDDNDLNGVAQVEGGGEMTGAVKSEEDDREGAETTAMPTPSAEECERLRTRGMDWGVVGVWSCPRSCEVSCEERVVVQLPI